MKKEIKENWEKELADKIIRLEYPTYENAIPGIREHIISLKEQIEKILSQEKLKWQKELAFQQVKFLRKLPQEEDLREKIKKELAEKIKKMNWEKLADNGHTVLIAKIDILELLKKK